MKAHKPAAMAIMRRLSIIAVLFLCFQISLYAAVSAKKKPSPAASHKKVTSKPVLDILKKYQSIKTYHTLWRAELKQGQRETRLEYETAFERKSGKTLFAMWTFLKKDDQWTFMGGMLQIYDGSVQKVASRFSGQLTQKEFPVSDPNSFTYRDFRRKLGFVFPFDLPLLYPDHALTEYPLKEFVQGLIEEIKVIKPKPEATGKTLTLEVMTNGMDARMHVDSKTLLVKDFVYFQQETAKNVSPKFTRVSCETNKPLRPGLFDFKSHLQSLKVLDVKQKPARKAPRKVIPRPEEK